MHTTTCIALLAVLAIFMWLNFDFTRDAYDENVDGKWRGGVRHGFPVVAWDAGDESQASRKGDSLSLTMRPFGGWQPVGLLVDVSLFFLALAGTGFLTEKVSRQSRSPANIEIPTQAPSLHPAAYPVMIVAGVALVWANLRVDTQLVELPDGRHDFHQAMGWPLKCYQASQPDMKSVPNGNESMTKTDKLVLLQSNPGTWYRRAHWSLLNIVFNVLIGFALLIACVGLTHYIFKRQISSVAAGPAPAPPAAAG